VLSIAFWVLGFLIFGTYLLDDDVDSDITLFPLARGFRIKPAVYVFAPVWFLCCMVFAYAVFLKIQEAGGMGASPFRVLAIKVVGLTMVGAGLMCLFVTIPLWEEADAITIALVSCFPLWFFVGQGFTHRSALYVSSYIVLSVLSALKNVATQLNVIASVILLIQLMVYPCCFPRPNVKLYVHFEVLSQRRVVEHRQIEKQYEMVSSEASGAYADRDGDYTEAEKVSGQKAAQDTETKPKADRDADVKEKVERGPDSA
jgi:hypothetical protein